MKSKRTVVIGFVGTQLDSGKGSGRWERWRPTIALTQHDDIIIDRIELLYNGHVENLIRQVSEDIASVSPETTVVPHHMHIENAWDFEDVYGTLFDFAKNYPFDPDALIDLDLSRYDQIAQRFSREHAEGVDFLKSGIATRNDRFNTMIDEIERVAIKSKAPMLLMGPTGAGKSFLARRIYELKKARHQLDGKFVELNCATLHGDGAASTLFGHIKGSFTGAASDRPGLLRTAHKGLLFLDEIGELGADEQAMLLKAVEEKRFLPVGSDNEVQSDFQLIAGTNLDLAKEVVAGRFREDLYARINLWTYALPGLGERPEDIEPNLAYLLARFSEENGQMVRFNKEARASYMRFAMSPQALWVGNFRDLSASVTRMATLAEAGGITEAIVDDETARLQRLWRHHNQPATGGDVDLADVIGEEALQGLDLFDAMQLRAVIGVCRQSKSLSDAGRKLYGVSRDAKSKPNDADRLKKFLARFGLSWDQVA